MNAIPPRASHAHKSSMNLEDKNQMRTARVGAQEKIVQHLKEKKELRALPDAFILRAWMKAKSHLAKDARTLDELLAKKMSANPSLHATHKDASFDQIKKNKSYQALFKHAREILRKQQGMFSAKEESELKTRLRILDELEELQPNSSAYLATLRKLLATHPSTQERIEDLQETMCYLFKDIPLKQNTIRIADIGSGMSAASIPLWNIGHETQERIAYLAYDISEEDLLAAKRVCDQQHISCAIRTLDAGEKGAAQKIAEYIQEDLAALDARKHSQEKPDTRAIRKEARTLDFLFLFKVADVLEKQEKGAVHALLTHIPARIVVISFATQSLSGKKEFQKRRPWLEKTVLHLGKTFETYETKREFFYKISST